MSAIPTISLHNGHAAPQLGLGVWKISNEDASDIASNAFQLGYRLIDTAMIYGNEDGVGKVIRNSGIERSNIFVSTKLWNTEHGHTKTPLAFKQSLEQLGLDYIDLYLIHWPVPKIGQYVQAWEAMIQLRDEGVAKSIGVCNFNINHLQELLDQTGVIPVVNQIELHPYFQQEELRTFHAQQGIATQAWSPLGHGTLWNDPTLLAIAQKHNRSVAQIILRWHIQLGNMVIPKASTIERLRQNMQVFDFALSDTEMELIASLDKEDGRLGPDPVLFRLPKN